MPNQVANERQIVPVLEAGEPIKNMVWPQGNTDFLHSFAESHTYAALKRFQYLLVRNIQTTELLLKLLKDAGLLSLTMINDIRDIHWSENEARNRRLLKFIGPQLQNHGNVALFCSALDQSGHQILSIFIKGEIGTVPGKQTDPTNLQANKTTHAILEDYETVARKNMPNYKEFHHRMRRRVSEQLENIIAKTYVRAMSTVENDNNGLLPREEGNHIVRIKRLQKEINQMEAQVASLSSALHVEKMLRKKVEANLVECGTELNICYKKMSHMTEIKSEKEKDLYIDHLYDEVKRIGILKTRLDTIDNHIGNSLTQADRNAIKIEVARGIPFNLPEEKSSQQNSGSIEMFPQIPRQDTNIISHKRLSQSESNDQESSKKGQQSILKSFVPIVLSIECGIEKLLQKIQNSFGKYDKEREKNGNTLAMLCQIMNIPTSTKEPLIQLESMIFKFEDDQLNMLRKLEIIRSSLREEVQSRNTSPAKSIKSLPKTDLIKADQYDKEKVWEDVLKFLSVVKDELTYLRQENQLLAEKLRDREATILKETTESLMAPITREASEYDSQLDAVRNQLMSTPNLEVKKQSNQPPPPTTKGNISLQLPHRFVF